jgi:hypothetical protein
MLEVHFSHKVLITRHALSDSSEFLCVNALEQGRRFRRMRSAGRALPDPSLLKQAELSHCLLESPSPYTYILPLFVLTF